MGKPKGLRTARKLKKHRQEQRWCDKKGYKVGTEFEKKKLRFAIKSRFRRNWFLLNRVRLLSRKFPIEDFCSIDLTFFVEHLGKFKTFLISIKPASKKYLFK